MALFFRRLETPKRNEQDFAQSGGQPPFFIFRSFIVFISTRPCAFRNFVLWLAMRK
jgi:hypothetical protein